MVLQLILFQEVFKGAEAGFIGFVSLKQWVYANVNFLPLIPAIIVVGGLIIFTLTYVSWRKYRAERHKTKYEKDKIVD